MSKQFGLVVGLSLLGLNAFAGDVKLHVEMTGGSFDAKSAQVQGFAIQQGNQLTASQIVVPLKTLDSGNGMRDNHMKNKYLEIAKYPNAILTNVRASGGKFTGQLNIHGVNKPVSGEYELKGNQISASFKTQLTEHAVPQVNYMGIGVEDEVEITANIPVQVGTGRLPASVSASPKNQ